MHLATSKICWIIGTQARFTIFKQKKPIEIGHTPLLLQNCGHQAIIVSYCI